MNIIISLYHTMRHEKYITLWRPNNAGYCYNKEIAGIYDNPEKGYHDSDLNMPIDKEMQEKLFTIKVMVNGKWQTRIPNDKTTWKILNVKMTRDGLKKIQS